MIEIQTLYMARIDFESSGYTQTELFADKAFELDFADDDLEVEIFYGNAVCNPYLNVSSEDKSKVQNFIDEMQEFIAEIRLTFPA